MLVASQSKRERVGIDKSQLLENVTPDVNYELPKVGNLTVQSHHVSDAPTLTGIFSSTPGGPAAYLTQYNKLGRNTAGAGTTKNARANRQLASVTYKELGKSIDKTTGADSQKMRGTFAEQLMSRGSTKATNK